MREKRLKSPGLSNSRNVYELTNSLVILVKFHIYMVLAQSGVVLSEMGIYRENLSAIAIGDNSLPIIVIAQSILILSITNIAVVIYFVIADKLSQ